MLEINLISKASKNTDDASAPPVPAYYVLSAVRPAGGTTAQRCERNADAAVCTICSLVQKQVSCDSRRILKKDCTDWSKQKKKKKTQNQKPTGYMADINIYMILQNNTE